MQEFGLIGLGVMGKSLARNLARNGFKISVFNRHLPGKEENVAKNFLLEHPAELAEAQGFDDLEKFVASLARPRKVFLMVNAGAATESVLKEIEPLLAAGDVLLDGGNAHFKDTARRTQHFENQGIHYLGTGVSGGEKGALLGPAIMPGGSAEAYFLVKKFLEKIAARDRRGKPCCARVGDGGAGHFVKMVHNGIEYAEMQLLAETYFLLKNVAKKSNDEIADLLETWQSGRQASFLLEITVKILRTRDGDGQALLDKIVDSAGSKGTGSWATSAAAELGVPATMISEALFARHLSALKNERTAAVKTLRSPVHSSFLIPNSSLKNGYETARILNHHQGFELIRAAAAEFGWQVNLPEIARIWTGGCIIRSKLMEKLAAGFRSADSVLAQPELQKLVFKKGNSLRRVAARGIESGCPLPCFSAAANFLNGFSTEKSAANLLQAQRDFFGAHTFQRMDDAAGKFYHFDWEG